MNRKAKRELIECHQEIVNELKWLADFELVASHVFYFLNIDKYSNYFDKMSSYHYDMIDEIVKCVIDEYDKLIIAESHCYYSDLIKEIKNVKESEIEIETIKEIIYTIFYKEEEKIDEMIELLEEKVDCYKENKKSYLNLKHIISDLENTCKEIKREKLSLKYCDYDISEI